MKNSDTLALIMFEPSQGTKNKICIQTQKSPQPVEQINVKEYRLAYFFINYQKKNLICANRDAYLKKIITYYIKYK